MAEKEERYDTVMKITKESKKIRTNMSKEERKIGEQVSSRVENIGRK